MELGNAVFGNSRGEVPVNREKYQGLFIFLEDAIRDHLDLQEHAYVPEFNNDVFSYFPYYWGDCDCGYGDLEENWHMEHKHKDSCYISRETKELVENGITFMDDNYTDFVVNFRKEHGIENPKDWREVNLCTCGNAEEWLEFVSSNYHKDTCSLVRPNFVYYPNGYTLSWYKYPLRDSYANRRITRKEFYYMIHTCIESLKKE